MGVFQSITIGSMALHGYIAMLMGALYFFQRKRPEHLALALINSSWMVVCYTVYLRLGGVVPDQGRWIVLTSLLAQIFTVLLLVYYTVSYLEERPSWPEVFNLWFLAGLGLFYVYGTWVDLPGFRNVLQQSYRLPGGETIQRFHVSGHSWFYLYYMSALGHIGWCIRQGIRHRQDESGRGKVILAAYSLLGGMAILGVLSSFGAIPALPWLTFGITSMLLVHTLLLDRELGLVGQYQKQLDEERLRIARIADTVPGVILQFEVVPQQGIFLRYMGRNGNEFFSQTVRPGCALPDMLELLSRRERSRFMVELQNFLDSSEYRFRFVGDLDWQGNGTIKPVRLDLQRSDDHGRVLLTGIAIKNDSWYVSAPKDGGIERLVGENRHECRAPLLNIYGFSREIGELLHRIDQATLGFQQKPMVDQLLQEAHASLKVIRSNTSRLERQNRHLIDLVSALPENALKETDATAAASDLSHVYSIEEFQNGN